MKLTKQQKRNKVVLERLIAFANEYENFADDLADDLETLLDKHAAYDCFGTEGECDPRGDQRDNCFHMKRVQGVDK